MQNFTRGSAVLLVAALLAGFAGGAFANKIAAQSDAADGKTAVENRTYVEESSVIDAIEKVAPAAASIVATRDLEMFRSRPFPFFDDFFSDDPFFRQFQFNSPQPRKQERRVERRQVSGGTGFILTADGMLFTNKHVVLDDEADYTIILHDGSEYRGEVLDRDPLNDLAVMQLYEKDSGKKPDNLPTVKLGDSDKIKVGQRVLAIGNALAEFENTVTMGIVSGKGRDITAGGAGFAENLSGLIQTDAAINPGNSGGPLVNLDGEVIGVNTAVANANGIGFAIPINDAKQVIASIQKNGKIVHPQLGVRFMMLTEQSAEELGIKDVKEGALIVRGEREGEFAVVPGSGADKAGLREGDIIREVNSKKVTLETPLQNIIRESAPGDKITLKILRSGKEITVKVTVGEA